MKICSGVGFKLKPSSGRALSRSNPPSTTHMKAAWPAAVPPVCTMLYSKRPLFFPVMAATALRPMNAKNALTTEMVGPKPSFSTTYG